MRAKFQLGSKVSASLPLERVTWQIFDQSFSPEKLALEEGTLLKEKPHRRVYKYGELILKAFKAKPFQPDQARKEALLGQALGDLAPKVLAYGRGEKWRFVITKYIHGLSLDSYLKENFPALTRNERETLFQGLARFLKGLFKREVFQPDFHLQNILFEPQTGNLYLLDLHRAHRVTYTPRRVYLQLAYLLPPLLSRLSWWEVGRLVVYLSRFFPTLKERAVRLYIQRQAFALMRKHFQRKEKHMFALFSFQGKRSWKQTFLYSSSHLQNLLDAPLDPSKRIKDSRTTKSTLLEQEGQTYLIKAYHLRGPLHALSRILWGSRARRTFQNHLRLALRGVPTILPLAFREERFQTKGPQGLLVYPWIPEARRDWRAYWEGLDKKEKRLLLHRLVSFLWEIHERGVFHGDAKITNFVLFNNGKLAIIDLDNLSFYVPGLVVLRRLQDLACLAFSLARFEPHRQREVLEEVFSYYAFLCPEVNQKHFLRFCQYVEKLFQKRARKEGLPYK